MRSRSEGFVAGVLGGVAGLVAMSLVRRAVAPLVRQREPKPTDIFVGDKSMSLIGPQHEPGERATEALARIAFTRVMGRQPSAEVKQRLGQAVHYGYGLTMAGLFGAIVGRRAEIDPVRAGALFGAALWAVGDELAVPLLGLADRPTEFPVSTHLQALVAHLGYGAAVAGTLRAATAVNGRRLS